VRGNAAAPDENILAHVEPAVIAQQPPIPAANVNSNAKTYTAEPGDTLGKIAGKTMGKNTAANRDAILKLNPKLAENPSKINIGDTLSIPASEQKETVAKETKISIPAPASNSVEYVVKEGDNLHKIAREQCGSVSFVTQIQDLNKDVLKGSDKLKIGMKLK